MKVTLVYGDDWTGIYVDGKLATENHSFRERETLEAVGINPEIIWIEGDWGPLDWHCPAEIEKLESLILEHDLEVERS